MIQCLNRQPCQRLLTLKELLLFVATACVCLKCLKCMMATTIVGCSLVLLAGRHSGLFRSNSVIQRTQIVNNKLLFIVQ